MSGAQASDVLLVEHNWRCGALHVPVSVLYPACASSFYAPSVVSLRRTSTAVHFTVCVSFPSGDLREFASLFDLCAGAPTCSVQSIFHVEIHGGG